MVRAHVFGALALATLATASCQGVDRPTYCATIAAQGVEGEAVLAAFEVFAADHDLTRSGGDVARLYANDAGEVRVTTRLPPGTQVSVYPTRGGDSDAELTDAVREFVETSIAARWRLQDCD